MKDIFGDELRGAYCRGCPLNSSRPMVKSSGNIKTAKVVLVGEAPGENEEKQGKPFVGRAGSFLRSCLEEVGISEDDVYFCNVCRCRPPGNRTPVAKEISRCLRYLRNELDGFQGLIVLLGSTALSAFLGRSALYNSRGYGFYKNGKRFFVTYHPSAVLRFSKYEDFFKKDLKKVKIYLDPKKKIKYNIINDVESFEKFLSFVEDGILQSSGKFRLAFDLETSGLDPFKSNSKILSMAFSDGSESWVIPLEHEENHLLEKLDGIDSYKEFMELIEPIFHNESIRLIGQNGKFDIIYLKRRFGIEVRNYWFDTMIAHFLINGKGYPHKLKSMAWKYTDFGGYEIDVENAAEISLDKLSEYNAMDAFVTYRLMEIFIKELSSAQYDLMTEVLSPSIMAVSEIEHHGIFLDSDLLNSLIIKHVESLTEIEEKLHNYPEIKEIEKKRKKLINFNSSKQLGQILDSLKIKPSKRTKKTQAISTDEEALEEIKDQHPFIPDLLKYREESKIINTYLEPYVGLSRDGFIHGDYGFVRTVTGRLACHQPNMQNIPYKIRPVFTASKDWLVEVDYSQLELRVLAMYSKDESLVDCFKKGEDIHEQTRASIAHLLRGKDKTRQRVIAKGVNFGIVYGISDFGLAREIGISQKAAKQAIDSFYLKRPGAKRWIEETKKFAAKNGYLETFFGRKRYFSFSHVSEEREKKILREAINFPIQSAASDLVLFATGRVWKKMREMEMSSRMVAHVHDMILFDCVDSELEILIKVLLEEMENLEYPWINVPLIIDIKIGKSWGKLEEISQDDLNLWRRENEKRAN